MPRSTFTCRAGTDRTVTRCATSRLSSCLPTCSSGTRDRKKGYLRRQRIASFSVDHLLLQPGVYVSRIDRCRCRPTSPATFDLRLDGSHKEPVMNTAEGQITETWSHVPAQPCRVVEPHRLLWAYGLPDGFLPRCLGERRRRRSCRSSASSSSSSPASRAISPVPLRRNVATTSIKTFPWRSRLRRHPHRHLAKSRISTKSTASGASAPSSTAPPSKSRE